MKRLFKLAFGALPLCLAALSSAACSSSDDPATSGGGNTDEKRGPIGKADALSGMCQSEGTNLCGGKSNGNCWCDDACSAWGDCCGDYKSACTNPTCPDPEDPGVHYINGSYKNPLACTTILFACEPGQTPFSDECGCGCIDAEAPECPDPNDPSVHYVADSAGKPDNCATILFTCEPGQTPFSNDCGCGCVDAPEPSCPDPKDPKVHYVAGSDTNPAACLNILFTCDPGQHFFSNECGCGCIDGAQPSCPDPNDPKVHYVAGSDTNPAACLNILFACEANQSLFSNDCGCGCIDP